ncbi:hypothetical protein BO94DRAFT_530748 [Aspergillus sclerotioniger CBS 115572]|uniref:Uncharacterized protein n=1 Tax=Aspergillus sclerotioniger CBS 115572 TaxID=1450535 RepID=A0A317XD29_9EURO|nr:hypothetical protein BO94DRAFT_530748 [Aspergillus sclerotioniger CBS 115572]PWY96041.1 hypothetical protein BO94DRAFT_530748 [Aspergillus sclerotioniger CBS 115572]
MVNKAYPSNFKDKTAYPIQINDFDSYASVLLEDHPIRSYPTQPYTLADKVV